MKKWTITLMTLVISAFSSANVIWLDDFSTEDLTLHNPTSNLHFIGPGRTYEPTTGWLANASANARYIADDRLVLENFGDSTRTASYALDESVFNDVPNGSALTLRIDIDSARSNSVMNVSIYEMLKDGTGPNGETGGGATVEVRGGSTVTGLSGETVNLLGSTSILGTDDFDNFFDVNFTYTSGSDILLTFGVNRPVSSGDNGLFRLNEVSIIPEPGVLTSLLFGGFLLTVLRRKMRK